MRSSRLARRAAPSRAAGRLARTLAVLLALAAVFAPSARADEADDLRAEMIAGGPGKWRTVFRRIESNPVLLGRTLGPVFRDRAARVRPLSAWAAAALADRAGRRGEALLLSEEILLRAADDLEYVGDLRSNLDDDGRGWKALVDAARDRMLDSAADHGVRSAAASFLRHEPSAQAARDLATAWERAPPQVAEAAADSLQSLLVTRFESPAAARAFFAKQDRKPFVDWIRAASLAKDGSDWPVRLRMVEEARKNVERLSTPAELLPYLSVETTPYVEVRRLAAKRAGKVEAPAEAWLPLLVLVVRREDDQETLLALLEVAKRLRLTDREKALELARSILARLEENRRNGTLGLGLVNLLASVADREVAEAAFHVLEPEADGEMLDALLSLAGRVGGMESLLTSFHAARAGKTEPAVVRLRAKALDALAQGAKESADPDRAGRYLRAVLRLDDSLPSEVGLLRETSLEGRRAAVLALQSFPGAATARRLADVAGSEAPDDPTRTDEAPVARLATQVLGRLAADGDEEAALALVRLASDVRLKTVRVDALKALARLPAEAPADVLREATGAVRSALLLPSSPKEVRLAAAEAAEALADAGSLVGLAWIARDQVRLTPGSIGPVQPHLEGLVRRLARAGPESDRIIASTLQFLAAEGALESAIAIGSVAAEEGQGRLGLQVARAELLRLRARGEGVSTADRVRGHQEAERILRTAVAAVPSAERGGEAWGKAVSLRIALLDTLLDDEAALTVDERRQTYVARVEAAAAAADPAGVPAALDVARRARSLDLTSEEVAALARAEEALKRLLPP